MGDEVRRAVKRYLGKNVDVPAFRMVEQPGFDDDQAAKLTGLSAHRLAALSQRFDVGGGIDLSYEDVVSGDFVGQFRWDGVDLLHARAVSDLDHKGVPALVLLIVAREFRDDRDYRVANGGLEGYCTFADLLLPARLEVADRWAPWVVRHPLKSGADADWPEDLRSECAEAEAAVADGVAVRYEISKTARRLVTKIKAAGLSL